MDSKSKKVNLNHKNKFTNHISFKTIQCHKKLGEFFSKKEEKDKEASL